MNYWLIKSEPVVYSWENLERDKKTFWDGVRNFQARNNLKAMKNGDLCLYYHSNEDKANVGVAKVVKEHYPDPTADDPTWVAVEVAPEFKLKKPVPLALVKANPKLTDMVLVRNSRLSVQPVKKEEFDEILAMSEA